MLVFARDYVHLWMFIILVFFLEKRELDANGHSHSILILRSPYHIQIKGTILTCMHIIRSILLIDFIIVYC